MLALLISLLVALARADVPATPEQVQQQGMTYDIPDALKSLGFHIEHLPDGGTRAVKDNSTDGGGSSSGTSSAPLVPSRTLHLPPLYQGGTGRAPQPSLPAPQSEATRSATLPVADMTWSTAWSTSWSTSLSFSTSTSLPAPTASAPFDNGTMTFTVSQTHHGTSASTPGASPTGHTTNPSSDAARIDPGMVGVVAGGILLGIVLVLL
ncbi:uncharacterized protein PFL1_03800 [Pseudozyma flocculosa PF-1]|uniref:Uncharacterized protein n=1 Tax=Pseudozyma flocculosa PF-1 TaxID=1277687 RepID=A0A061H6J3_9BASI|nr:uncharacterized protein PFL1_03800 [Pseudozyma flocculosa PF-1]EPQ28497.1 hypothetical protein PFL1_03800 [Pseudozyma flocculosa PF-1]